MAIPLPQEIAALVATIGDYSRSGQGITRKFIATTAQCEAAWAAMSHNTVYELGTEEEAINLYFNRDNSTISRKEGGLSEIALTFTDTATDKSNPEHREAGDMEYTLNSYPQENPLEMHANYKKCHNYNLYQLCQNPGDAVTTPAWWATATTDADAVSSGGVYQWAKEQPQQQEGQYWKLVQARTKSFDVYINNKNVITITTYKASRAAAEADMVLTGVKSAPAIIPDFFQSGVNCWLVTNSYIQKSAKKWCSCKEYTYAPQQWDADYYA